MIRFVTAGRLRRLEEEAEQARTRMRAVQAQAAAAWCRHVREVWDLTVRAETAESDAAILRGHVEEYQERVRLLAAELAAAEEAGLSLVLLLHWGEPHSIHASRECAFAYAATQDAPIDGWVPSDGRVHAEVAWQVLAFTRDESVMGLCRLPVRSPQDREGAA
ncbi:hypothetical protein [Streptomyces werraensis]|uniref:Uncharacterized protein n=1 Tax=Streptomyces werraensis TaxID=68284 RepID=A0ABV3JKV2_9ACTN